MSKTYRKNNLTNIEKKTTIFFNISTYPKCKHVILTYNRQYSKPTQKNWRKVRKEFQPRRAYSDGPRPITKNNANGRPSP